MKKIVSLILLLGLSSFTTVVLSQTPRLTFRFSNPRIIYTTNQSLAEDCDNLQFDVDVKCDSAGTRYFSLQLNLTVDATALDLSAGFDFIENSSFVPSLRYNINLGFVAGQMNVFITSKQLASDNTASHFVQINQTYSRIGTFTLKILDITKVAGINFIKSSGSAFMDGQEFQKLFNPAGTRVYSNPNNYDSKVLTRIYLGRIYSSTSSNYGWSQVGGTTVDLQYLDWTTGVNTSVWDTAASAATISTAASKATKLRVHSGARLKILPGGQLTCTDSTTISEAKGLWIAAGTGSGGTGTADGSFIDNGTISYNSGGTAKEERYLKQGSSLSPYIWHSLCIPVTSTTTAPFVQLYMKWYDEVNHKYWYVINPPLDSILNTSMKGYFMWSNPSTTGNKTMGVTGSLNTGSQSISLTRSSYPSAPGLLYNGYNFVGNPYPSSLDWTSGGWTLTNLTPVMWFWNDASGNYGIYNRNTNDSTLTVSRYIPPMQGFFVKVDSNFFSGSLGVNNTARLHKPVAYWKEGEENGFTDRLSLAVTGTGGGDEAVIRFDPASGIGYNPGFDAYKYYGSVEAPQLYSILTDAKATLYVLPWTGVNQVVPLGFSCGVSGDFTITAGNISSFRPGVEIYLEDKQIPGNAWPNLRTNPVYQFSYTTGEDPSRFILHFTNLYFGINNITKNAMQIYSYEDFVYVKNITGGNTQGDVFIYDLTGRKIFQDKLQNSLINKYRININEGYYLVNVITPDNAYHQKVYLK